MLTLAMDSMERSAEAFGKLDGELVSRIAAFGRQRHVMPGEALVEQGQTSPSFYVVLRGAIEIVVTRPDATGEEIVRVEGPGEFTGELDVLAGSRSLVRARAREPSEVLEVDRNGLRRLVATDPELSDILIRTFVVRRMVGLALNLSDTLLVGSRHSAATLGLREFLGRNGQPYTYLDLEDAPDVEGLVERFQVRVEDIPVLVCCDNRVLRNPSKREVADSLGFNPRIDESAVRDVVVVGAGPAGLAAAVYAASEGLDVLVVEAQAPGGQAGTSSKIENYLGFPTGVSGQDLAARAYAQAAKFGAEVVVARTAVELDCERYPYELQLAEGGRLLSRAVVIASGARYRRPSIPDLSRFEGSGVYYGATHVEAELCTGQEVIVVGGGNSAGQAAVFLATRARRVHMLVRSAGLRETMSRYLIRRIEKNPAITLRLNTEVVGLEGRDDVLARVCWRNTMTGEVETAPIHHVFMMIGADPNTDWLKRCLVLDDRGFVKTGIDLARRDLDGWPATMRRPYTLETSIPRVFAVGDIRSGSIKRVASAVGEGAACIQLVHRALEE